MHQPRDYAEALAIVTEAENKLRKDYLIAQARLEGVRRSIQRQWDAFNEKFERTPTDTPAEVSAKVKASLTREAEARAKYSGTRKVYPPPSEFARRHVKIVR